jgi:hypothetical protein
MVNDKRPFEDAQISEPPRMFRTANAVGERGFGCIHVVSEVGRYSPASTSGFERRAFAEGCASMKEDSTLFSGPRDSDSSRGSDLPRPASSGRGLRNISMTRRYAIRELEHSDLPEMARILAEGFPRHSLECWQARLRTLAQRDPAPGTPLFGYGLDVDGLQGVGLTIGSLHGPPEGRQTIVNGSSWTVRPAHRGAAAIELYRRSTSGKGMTFSDLSSGANTRKIIKICGFTEYTAGTVIAVGVARGRGPKRRIVHLSDAERSGLSPDRAEMMRYHQARGCLTFCVGTNGRLAPFIFIARSMRSGLRVAQLIYCERLRDLIDNSLAITLEAFKRGCAALLVDGSGPIEGLKGRYFPSLEPKYYKGPAPLYAIDHSYSELIYFRY